MSGKVSKGKRSRLLGKVALVTGASRGIGRGIALALAGEGCDVAVNFVGSKEKAQAVVKDIKALGRRAIAVQADVSDEGQVERMRDTVHKELGPVDIIVNSAGIHQHLKFWELSRKDWDRVIAVNLTGPFLVTKAFIEDMKGRKRGRVVHISSIIGMVGTDHEIHYAASKAGLFAVTKSMALELAPFGITVNCIAPGWIDTDMTADFKGPDAEALLRKIPLHKVGQPDDIAKAVVFLASDDAAWVTGETVHVNGGWGMY
jgi:3-oxoacyl-[acyl-carrier protein] reductase